MAENYNLLFRSVKRQYFKAKDIAKKLSKNEKISLQITGQDTLVTTKLNISDQELFTRFVVIMRRFLDPTDNIYFKRIWNIFIEVYSAEISVTDKRYIERSIHNLTKNDFEININDNSFSAEKIYHLISEGGYFSINENTEKKLNDIRDMPIIGQLFWFQFYNYTFFGFNLAKRLYDIIIKIEKSEKYLNSFPIVKNENKCIYCLSTSTSFYSEEHIFPESLGNDELVLPKGFVCDKCNNGILAELDNALLRFEPIALLQVQFVPYTKSGKFPVANFQNLTIKRTSPRNIDFIPKDKTGKIRNRKELGNGYFSFNINIGGSNFKPRLIGRALYKIALGIVALSQGQAVACDSKFDKARNFICNDAKISNSFFIKTNGNPNPSVKIEYHNLAEGTPVGIDIFGLIFILDLENRSKLIFNDVIKKKEFILISWD